MVIPPTDRYIFDQGGLDLLGKAHYGTEVINIDASVETVIAGQ